MGLGASSCEFNLHVLARVEATRVHVHVPDAKLAASGSGVRARTRRNSSAPTADSQFDELLLLIARIQVLHVVYYAQQANTLHAVLIHVYARDFGTIRFSGSWDWKNNVPY